MADGGKEKNSKNPHRQNLVNQRIVWLLLGHPQKSKFQISPYAKLAKPLEA
jgi:hypothetical protein